MENSERMPASGLPIAHRGLRHLALRVRDVAAARKFYGDVFGMRPLWEPDAKTAYLSSGRDNLALHAREETAPGSGGDRALDHLGFVVATPAEVYAAAAAARAAGVRILQEAREHRDGSHSFYVADPDDNVVQILFEPNISPLL